MEINLCVLSNVELARFLFQMFLRLAPRLMPVVDRHVQKRVESDLRLLLRLPQYMPLSVPRPWNWVEDEEKQSQASVASGTPAVLAWLPGNLTILMAQQGGLFHSFLLPRPKLCINDSSDGPRPCSLYEGTVIGVDIDDQDPCLWAHDVYAIRGEPIIDEPHEWRRQRLARICACVPQLKSIEEHPKADKTRFWGGECRFGTRDLE